MKIPVILNNRNLVTYPKKMVEALSSFEDVGDIIIIDNDSTYPPLLEWYATKPCEIIRTKNNGHLCPWIIELPKKLNSEFYIVTDSDLDLSLTPRNSLSYLKEKLRKHGEFDKIGLSLENWDVSVNSPYFNHLRNWAQKSWAANSVIDGLLTDQQVDTTFAIYNINRNPRGTSCATDSPYSAKHIPWDFTYDTLSDLKNKNYEYYYYLDNSNSSSSYKGFVNFNGVNNPGILNKIKSLFSTLLRRE